MIFIRKSNILLVTFITVLLITGCSKGNDAVASDLAKNESVISVSPDGKYRAEAYGAITDVTAGGLFPYEGIRILNVVDDEVIWEMNPGGYSVSFTWSPDSKFTGIYYTGRIWGKSIIVDVIEKKSISLPEMEEIASYFGDSEKPQEERSDPYFEIAGWEDSETVIVDFRWTMTNVEVFSGRFTFNVIENEIIQIESTDIG